MKRLFTFVYVFIFALSTLSGCGTSGTRVDSEDSTADTSPIENDTSDNSTAENSASDSEASENEDGADASDDSTADDFAKTNADMFTNRDYEVGFDETNSVQIQLNGDSVSASSDSVRISGTTVTITEEATYILSGTLDDGMIIVDTADTAKLQLVLNGVNINSETSAPLYILEADKVFVTLAADTENSLSNGGTFTAIDKNNIDAAIFSKQDLTLNGSGSLTVKSPAGHGIVCKDDLVMTSGDYIVNSASHGLDANDSVRIANAKITVDAGKDGIHAENSDDTSLGFVYIASGTLDIRADGDGISAGAHMQMEGGDFSIISGGGSEEAANNSSTSIKGLKAAGSMLFSNGTFTINSADDAVHSNASITVNGGTFEIASGDDGFHADETLTVTAGEIHISESYEGMEALALDISGGDIELAAADDGLNAAGGRDSSGTGGMRGDDKFGGGGMHGNERFHGGGMRGNDKFDGADDRTGGSADSMRWNGTFDGTGDDIGGGRMHGGGAGGGSSASNGSIVISGGHIYVQASGDGIDSNGTLLISGGYTTVCGPTQGDTATLDYDVSGVITGGTFIGTGALGMAQTFSDSEQGVVTLKVGEQPAGTEVTLKDQGGNTIISHTPELPFAVVILSSPEIASGETYTVTVGSSSEEVKAS